MAQLHRFPKLFSMSAGKVIGILGGSFNPAHEGHVHIADMAVEALGLDEVWLMVSPQNPLKSKSGMAAFDDRLASALEMAARCKASDVMKVSTLERDLGLQLTHQTLKMLRQRMRYGKLVWIMGGDNLVHFHKWNRPDVITKNTAIAVVNRPGSRHLRSSPGARKAGKSLTPRVMRARRFPVNHWCYIQGKQNTQSATKIRSLSV